MSTNSKIYVSLQDPHRGNAASDRNVALGVPLTANRVLFLAQPGLDTWAGHDEDDPGRWERCFVLLAHRAEGSIVLDRRSLAKVHVFWLPKHFTRYHAMESGVEHRINGLTAVVAELDHAFEEEDCRCGNVDAYGEPERQLHHDIEELRELLAEAPDVPAPGPDDDPPTVSFSFSICWIVPWCLP